MTRIFMTLAVIFFVTTAFAQQKQHKIIFDYVKGDTASFALMVRQATAIMNAAGTAQVMVVCYGPGLNLIRKEKTTVQAEIEELQKKYNVVFAGCEASMKRQGIARGDLIPSATTVPLASLELSSRQQEGWSYIKAGY